MKAYKAFGPDWKCRDMQYEVGETYTYNGDAVICKSGFHACENPLDVLDYYDLTTCKIAEVEVGGTIVKHDEDSKVASSSISIKAELTLPEFIAAAIRFVWDACSKKQKDKADSAQLAASGDCAQLAASGDYAQLAASGDYAKLAASGDCAKLAASGNDSVIASSSLSAKAKGAAGTWISLAEFDKNGKCVGFAKGCVGKGRIKADTWYKAQGGKLVEVK